MKKLRSAVIILAAAALAFASCAFAGHRDTRYHLDVRTDLNLSRRQLARKVWKAAQTAARKRGFRIEEKLFFDEDREDDYVSPDVILYEIEMGEIKTRYGDSDLELHVRCRKADKAILSATLTWEAEDDQSRHAALYDALAAQTDLFIPPAK
ncbi:MAG: hypothetical protein IJU32_04720 [Pyramidobacter sp.]|nr:hypothetical protein [Pyramidobacter sp.]